MAGKKILLDAPANRPALGYEGIAAAFAAIITDSQPNFAIGIFGGWGSGKTTLMGAIKTALPTEGMVTVAFNAWRFEREPQLLVPLLDTIRGALADRAVLEEQGAAAGGGDRDRALRLRRTAGRVGRVVKALATGLSGSVGVPGAVTIKYDTKTAIEAFDALTATAGWRRAGARDMAPKSLYVAAFGELQAAFEELSSAGVTRIVVFVDDLDRCLPANALEVLESMKLFFDLPGFVFVVGLDEIAVDRALAMKLTAAAAGPPAADADGLAVAAAALGEQLGREYAKKIFQVPYTLPAMLPVQLDDLLESMYAEAGITGGQLTDLRTRVRRYLDVIAVQRPVNPREVKRFINRYTLQTLTRPDLVPEAILALQAIAFRPEWQPWYEAVTERPNEFRDAVVKFRSATTETRRAQVRNEIEHEFRKTSRIQLKISDELWEFLASDLMAPLAAQPDLDPYVSSLRSTRTPDALPGIPVVPLLNRSCGFTEGNVACATLLSFRARPYPMPACPNDRGLTAHQFAW